MNSRLLIDCECNLDPQKIGNKFAVNTTLASLISSVTKLLPLPLADTQKCLKLNLNSNQAWKIVQN